MREIQQGVRYPFHGKPPTDWAERAACGILYDLSDRRGIRHAFDGIDAEIKAEIVEKFAEIIRAAPCFTPTEEKA